MTLLEILDRPIAFHRPFLTITGSINAALMLSQAMYWSGRTEHGNGWFHKSRDEWFDELGLSHEKQEVARRLLRATKFWQERDEKLAHRVWFRIDIEELRKVLIETVPPNRKTRFRETVNDGSPAPRVPVPSKQTETTSEITKTPSAPAGAVTSNGSKMAGFESFWAGYPKERRTGKGAAMKAWEKNGCSEITDMIILSLAACTDCKQWRKAGGRFIPHPATWLNQKRWLDEPPPAESTAPKTRDDEIF